MATIEELQEQLAALTARVDAITAPPETYYTMQYQGETIDRLLSMAPDNLLDNVDFRNPVNQWNASGIVSAGSHFIDRWKIISGTAQITAYGIILNGTMQQTREFAVGTPTTASALTTTGVVAASYDDSTKVFTLTGTGQTFITAKLELGNVSTVGYQNSSALWVPTQIQDISTEELKCKRYLLIYPSFEFPVAFQAVNTVSIVGTLTFPVTMANTPTVQITKFRCLNSGQTANVTGATVYGYNGGISAVNAGQLTGDFTAFTQNNWYSFDFFASCEL